MNKTFKAACGLIIASAYYAENTYSAQDVDIRIETGEMKSIAVGDNANTSIQIGGLPPVGQGQCSNIKIQHGNLTRIAIGDNANATIQLPNDHEQCEED
jgi:hypothetical protein